MKLRSHQPGTAVVLAAAVLWGTAGTTASLEGIAPPAAQAAAWRGVLGAGALLLATAAAGRLHTLAAMLAGPRRTWLAGAAVAVAVFQVAFFTAVHMTGVALGTVVALGSAPVVGGAIRAITTRTIPSPRWTVATALAVAGVALLLLPTGDRAAEPLGLVLAAVAGAAFAGYTVVLQRHRTLGDHVLPTTAAVFTGSALLLAPLLALGDHSWLGSPAGAAVALWLGLVTAGLAYALYAAGLRTVPAPRALTMTLAEPTTAVLLGLVLLGEPLTPTGLAGLVLVGGGFVAASVRLPLTALLPPPPPRQPLLPSDRTADPRGGDGARDEIPVPGQRPHRPAGDGPWAGRDRGPASGASHTRRRPGRRSVAAAGAVRISRVTRRRQAEPRQACSKMLRLQGR